MPENPRKPATEGTAAVDAFMRTLDHPHKAEIEAVRAIILAASPDITEGIKWNAPSFARGDYFATFHLRARDGIQLILHLGAKVRDLGPDGITIDDPNCILEWLATDRATIKLANLDAVASQRSALEAVVRAWIAFVK